MLNNSKYNKVYVVCPTSIATGGTELLHQLVFKLQEKNIDSYIYYIGKYENSAVSNILVPKYRIRRSLKIDDKSSNLLISPENFQSQLFKYHKIKKAVWWLSVDNYKGANKTKKDIVHKTYYKLIDYVFKKIGKQWLHFVQSEYAYMYCINRKIDNKNIYYLSDYLNKTFIDSVTLSNTIANRKDYVLYNPKKGYKFTSKLIECNPQIKWIPIQNMTADDVKEIMLKSKVYIDFGNHPGKDRIPREAAICGCCIITGKKGAAANEKDIEIPSKYKFDEKNTAEILEMINYCLDNYSLAISDFKHYREKIINEESWFEMEINNIFQKI